MDNQQLKGVLHHLNKKGYVLLNINSELIRSACLIVQYILSLNGVKPKCSQTISQESRNINSETVENVNLRYSRSLTERLESKRMQIIV